MFALELQRRLEKLPSKVESIAAHSGWAKTKLNVHLSRGLKSAVMLTTPMFQSAQIGSLPILCAAVDPSARAGECHGPAGILETKGLSAKSTIPPQAEARHVSQRLWLAALQITSCKFLSLAEPAHISANVRNHVAVVLFCRMAFTVFVTAHHGSRASSYPEAFVLVDTSQNSLSATLS